MTQQVLEALREAGPMTTRELSEYLGITLQATNRALKTLQGTPRRVRIHSWKRDVGSARRYLRAVYAAGKGKDAPKPEALKITGAMHRATKNARFKASSIFRLTARSIA